MLPRFAPIVCITIMKAENFKLSVCFKIKIANGTNVIRATSFVINMLEKKQSKIKVKESVLRFFILLHNFFAQKEKTPRFWNPAITNIRESKIEITLKSIAFKKSMEFFCATATSEETNKSKNEE